METTATKNEVEELITALEDYGFECDGGSLKTCALWNRLKTAVAKSANNERTTMHLDTKIGRYRGICHKTGTLLETPIHRLRYTAKTLQGTQSACLEVAVDLENLRQNLLSL